VVKAVKFGDNPRKTSVSIERLQGRGKDFYRRAGVGLNPCRHDKKVTENRGLAVIRKKNSDIARRGIRPGKAAQSATGSR
jgi:hypothetical protein